MFDDLTSLILLALLLLALGPILGIAALLRAGRLRSRIETLEDELRRLRAPSTERSAPGTPAFALDKEAPSSHEEVGIADEEAMAPSAAPAIPEAQMTAAADAVPEIAPAEAQPEQDLERRLAQRWLVWLGAGALALGGIFFAAYAVEMGFLGPVPRVLLAAAFGTGLIVLALRLRTPASQQPQADFVPAALSAGGVATLYGAAVAAHMLYGLVASGVALALMALVSAAAILLGILFGPLVALLGCLGAYAAPALVQTSEPSTWALASYLAVVALVMHPLSRWQSWPWLAWLNLCLVAVWVIFWIAAGADGQPAIMALPPLILGLSALYAPIALHHRLEAVAKPRRQLGRDGLIILGLVLLLTLVVLIAADYEWIALACLTLLVLATLAAAATARVERQSAALAAAASLLAAICWHIPPSLLSPGGIEPAIVFSADVWLVPEAGNLAIALVCIGATFGLTGFWASRQGVASAYWAGLAVTVPLVALAQAFWRLEGLGPSYVLTMTALVMACLALGAASLAAERNDRAALAAWVTGGFGALALGSAIILRSQWLLIALSAHLPIIAYVAKRLEIPALRRPAMVLGLVVLVIAATVVDTGFYGSRGWLWALYGLGVPLVLTLLARHIFARERIDLLVELLDAVSLFFWLLLVTYVTRSLIGGLSHSIELAEAGVQVCAWLAGSLALLRLRDQTGGRHVLTYGWQFKLLLAAVEFATICLFDKNPLFTGEPVGEWPVLNVLLIAYLLPAVLTGAAARAMARRGWLKAAWVAGGVAVLIAMLWIALEIKRTFNGAVLDGSWSDGAQLALSLAWLLFAGLLLTLGTWRHDKPLRAGALAVACLAVLKAFLFDLAELEGLYRAASFVGLGLSLICIGWLYGHFVTDLPFKTNNETKP